MTVCTLAQGRSLQSVQSWSHFNELLRPEYIPVNCQGDLLTDSHWLSTRAEQSVITFAPQLSLRERILQLANRQRPVHSKLRVTSLSDSRLGELIASFNIGWHSCLQDYNQAEQAYLQEVGTDPLQYLYRCAAVGLMRARLVAKHLELALALLARQYVSRYLQSDKLCDNCGVAPDSKQLALQVPMLNIPLLRQTQLPSKQYLQPTQVVQTILTKVHCIYARYQVTCPYQKAPRIKAYLDVISQLGGEPEQKLAAMAAILQVMSLDPVLRKNRGLGGYLINRWYGYHCRGRDEGGNKCLAADGVTAPALLETALREMRRYTRPS